MSTDCLIRSVRDTHSTLKERLAAAREFHAAPDDPKVDRTSIDYFLGSAAKHLHAVDAVLLPQVRKECPEGKELVHRYLAAVKEVEVVLAHVKAHEYGSVYERKYAWDDVWSDVSDALAEQMRLEERLAESLTEQLPDDRLRDLTDRMEQREPGAPSRPHPYVPHTGLLGLVGRRVMGAADAFWDLAENRMVPERARPARKRPGLLGQYLLADPRFDEETLPEERTEPDRTPPRPRAGD